MTDLMMRSEAVNAAHRALTVPHNMHMQRVISRFGFEYEMMCLGEDEADPTYGVRRDVYRETEFDRHAMISRAYNAGLIGDPEQHTYHCHCAEMCSPTRERWLLTAQTDSTVDVEFVSRILDLNDFDRTAEEIETWVGLMRQWKRDGGWLPDGQASCGNHVHVEAHADLRGRQLAYANINALYAVYDWTDVADGGTGRIRDYNTKPSRSYPTDGSWLNDRGYGTLEHRLWNTPAVPSRLWAHLGISIGLQRYALAMARQNLKLVTGRTRNRWGEEVTGIDDDVFAMMADSLHTVVEQISDYIPDRPEFNIARDVITNLAVSDY